MPTKKLKRTKRYVIDTSSLLIVNNTLYRFKSNPVYIPLAVLEELDNHKKRMDSVGFNSRNIIKTLETLMKKGNLSNGVRISSRKSIISTIGGDKSLIPKDMDWKIKDNQILSAAVRLRKDNPNDIIILVTQDINLRAKGSSLGLKTEKIEGEAAVTSRSQIYTGWSDIKVDSQDIDKFYNSEELFLDRETVKKTLYPNEFLTLSSISEPQKSAIARFIDWDKPLRKIKTYKKRQNIQGIQPKNKEQAAALDLLLDPDVPLVSLIGIPGGGKSILACAAGLEMTMESGGKEALYDRFIVSRPVQPMGGKHNEIGYLPGSMTEKISPALGSIKDSLQYLIGDRMAFEDMIRTGQLELEALAHIRGRSLPRVFWFVDEAQNLTALEIKTIITRMGEGSKLCIGGDLDQIDVERVNSLTNGLTHAVEKFKKYSIAGSVLLHKGERSRLASLASKIL